MSPSHVHGLMSPLIIEPVPLIIYIGGILCFMSSYMYFYYIKTDWGGHYVYLCSILCCFFFLYDTFTLFYLCVGRLELFGLRIL